METRAKRVLRGVGPGEVPTSEAMPAEAPGPVVPAEGSSELPAEPAAEPAPAAADAVVLPGSPTAPALGARRDDPGDFGGDALAALEELRIALASGLEALSEEAAGLARRGIDTAARAAIQMLAVRTLSDAVAVNAGFAQTSFETWIGTAAKCSELGAKLAADSARPFLARLGSGWIASYRTGR